MYTIIESQPNTIEWLRARKNLLGASESAAVLGLSTWGTPVSVYLDKISETIEEKTSPHLEWGHRLEAPIAHWVRDQGHDVRPSPGLITTEAYPWLGATPDRVIADGDAQVPLEIKTSGAFMRGAWEERIPFAYQVQLQQQILLMGATHGYLAVLHGGNEPGFYRVPADPVFHEQLITHTRVFWVEHVLKRIPPEPATLADTAALWKGQEDLAVEGSEDLAEVWDAYGLLQAEIIDAQQRLDGMKFQLQKAMGDATALTYQGRTLFTWRTRKGSLRLDTKKLKSDHPEIYQKYLTEGAPTRTFLRKKASDHD